LAEEFALYGLVLGFGEVAAGDAALIADYDVEESGLF
jgi:hypothetical protein